ncbi:response regulator [Propionivibrio sp.]|uniref:response regulator n=1 Tax=Propionivibrio sp. TaxID=2212460 RepID=UPI0026183D3D|nr:response regulator [Propionivibrio sp.]
MDQSFTVFVVDDDPLVLEIISTTLEPDYQVQTFASAEDCLARLATEKPDFFLLDVSLPGMDGYTLCRQIKDDSALRLTPVTFLSGHDGIEDRVQGYEAGGADFIVKPFEPEELLRKLMVAQNLMLNQRSLAARLEDAELLSSMVIASMDETGILLQFMSKLIAMDSAEEIAIGLLELMQRFKLDGVVQTRLSSATQTLSAAGQNLPLEVSIIEHLRDQGRIFEFHKRSVHNFERVTVMVNNLPKDDPDFCGRLRDHLSVAAQGVDSRLKALQMEEDNRLAQMGIQTALKDIGDTLMSLREVQQGNTTASSKLIDELQKTLLNSFYRLGLTDIQEKFLQDLVGNFMDQMVKLLNRDNETQVVLQRLNDNLAQLRSN